MPFGRRTWALLLGGSLAVALPIACSSDASGPKDQNCCTDAGSGYTGPEGGGFETKTDAGDAAGDKSAGDAGTDAAADGAGGDAAGGDGGTGGDTGAGG